MGGAVLGLRPYKTSRAELLSGAETSAAPASGPKRVVGIPAPKKEAGLRFLARALSIGPLQLLTKFRLEPSQYSSPDGARA